jgi:hypothetical protein
MTPRYRRALPILFLMGILVLNVSPCFASFIGLGQAGNYVLFDVSNSQWQMNNSVVTGPMAGGPGTTYNWSGSGGPYSGPMYYQTEAHGHCHRPYASRA